MANLWSIRTGLELVEEKLTHWSESWITKLDDDVMLEYLADKSIHITEKGANIIDTPFAHKVLRIFFQPGSCASACRVEDIRHCGATYKSRSWFAVSDGRLVFIDQMLQVDGMAVGGGQLHSGQVRAKVEANRIIVSVARMLQLLEHQYNLKRECDVDVVTFPVPFLLAQLEVASWRWSAHSFTSLVSDTKTTFRPVHLARSKAE
eukprot:4758474-Pleurochrysis_carterae.AAC.1